MSVFTAIANIYILMTLTATAVLLHSFRHSFDDSARYFLSAEVLMTLAAALVGFMSYYPSAATPITNGIHNFFAISAEAMVLVSIASLHRKISLKFLLELNVLFGICCVILEFVRLKYGVLLANSLYFMIFIAIALLISFFCFKLPDAELQKNKFLRWIGIFECGVVLFYLIRLVASLSGVSIHYREPTAASISLFSFLITCNVFRYLSYIGLRITWVDSSSTRSNLLNERLAKSLEEKDRLLAGLMSSNRMIGISALASALAHQLSQPLTTISLQASTLQRDLTPRIEKNSTLAESLDDICQQSDYLSRLVGNLRQLFKSQSFKYQTVDLRQVIEQIAEIIRPTMELRNITLEIHFKDEPVVTGDRLQIQQVLINLLNNAAEAIEEKLPLRRVILINVFEADDYGIFGVEDSASGVAEENISRLFEIYQTTKENGLGVGLWLCKTIVDGHQGEMTVKNTVGSGAYFEVKLPLQYQRSARA
jgi:signal transduction histidine kinase